MAQRLSDLVSSLPALRQAQALTGLQSHFDAVLSPKFRGLVLVVGLEHGELRVLCANGAIASRLRLESQPLADALQQRGLSVRKVNLKVRPTSARKPPTTPRKAPLPAAARQAFQAAVKELDEGEIKSALQQLLKHHLENC